MCSRQQFFRVGAYAVFKSGAERILYPVQRSAFCQQRGPSAPHIPSPNSRSFAFHLAPLSVRPGLLRHLNCQDLSPSLPAAR
jgi:hypothetical protein